MLVTELRMFGIHEEDQYTFDPALPRFAEDDQVLCCADPKLTPRFSCTMLVISLQAKGLFMTEAARYVYIVIQISLDV